MPGLLEDEAELSSPSDRGPAGDAGDAMPASAAHSASTSPVQVASPRHLLRCSAFLDSSLHAHAHACQTHA